MNPSFQSLIRGPVIGLLCLAAGFLMAKPARHTQPDSPLMRAKRGSVQIVSAVYGSGGKNADVTAKVKDYVEIQRRSFIVCPKDLGADPNPYWNKELHIVFTKDGVQHSQRQGENTRILPECFYGPQDTAELDAWLPETRWTNADGDITFHANHTFTTLGKAQQPPTWEALGANKIRLTWSAKRTMECLFDTTWTTFSETGNSKNAFHAVK